MHFRMAGKSIEPMSQAQSRFVWIFLEGPVAAFLAICHGLFDVRGVRPGNPFRHAAHLVFTDPHHLRDVRKRRAATKGVETPDNGGVLSVFVEDEINHVILPVHREIDVDVRQLVQHHAVTIEKPPEIKLEPDWANVGDADAIANKAIRRASSRDPFDAAKLAIFEDVPHEQEILLVAHFRDDAQFFLDLAEDACRDRPGPAISAMRAFDGQTTQETPGRAAILGLVAWESQATQFEFEIALFGYFQRIASGLGIRAREVMAARKMKTASSLGGFCSSARDSVRMACRMSNIGLSRGEP